MSRAEDLQITYELHETVETLAGMTIRLQCLRDLDATIDDVFTQLQRHGKEHLLEKLCPYFGVIWPSARALIEEIQEKLSPISERSSVRVLELGCGLALPSLVLATQGFSLIATDSHPEVPRLLEINLALNPRARPNLQYIVFDWQMAWDHPPITDRLDWIIASDVLYESAGVGPLAKTIAKLAGEKTRVLIADPARPYLQAFTDEMTMWGFRHEARIRTAKDPHSPKDIFLVEYDRTHLPIGGISTGRPGGVASGECAGPIS